MAVPMASGAKLLLQLGTSTNSLFHRPLLSTPSSPSLRPLTNNKSSLVLRGRRALPPSSMSAIMTELEEEQREDPQILQQQEGPIPAGVSERWRKLMGEDDWQGLLDPMEPLLRSELIRYGEMAQACYDAFDYDSYSVNCGSCKYRRARFFQSVGLTEVGYSVTRYLYATSNIRIPNFLRRSLSSRVWSERANWIGFIAVSDDATTARLGRRDVVIAWRGTVTRLEWLADLTDVLGAVSSEGIPCPDPDVKVERGFLDLYTDKEPSCSYCRYSAREQVLAEVRRLLHLHQGEEVSVTVTGHSLGAALAVLSAYDIAETGANVVEGTAAAAPVCVYSFSGPRVGNRSFKERFEEVLKVKCLRVVNVHDKVPTVPGLLLNEGLPAVLAKVAESVVPWWSYSHVGVELKLDHVASPFLKDTKDPVSSHNLEAHLHLLDGYHGKEGSFALASGRDPALVNKASGFLKEQYLVPPKWKQDENRGLVRKEGRWVQIEQRTLDEEHEHHEERHEDMRHHLRQIGLLDHN